MKPPGCVVPLGTINQKTRLPGSLNSCPPPDAAGRRGMGEDAKIDGPGKRVKTIFRGSVETVAKTVAEMLALRLAHAMGISQDVPRRVKTHERGL